MGISLLLTEAEFLTTTARNKRLKPYCSHIIKTSNSVELGIQRHCTTDLYKINTFRV